MRIWCGMAAGIGLAFWVLPVQAQLQDQSQDGGGIAQCLLLADNAARLACYDRIAHAPAAAPASPAAPPGDAFGSEALRRSGPAAQPERLAEAIQDFKTGPGGFIVTLANGQAWAQADSDHSMVRFHPGKTRSVVISRGALGSYYLRFNDRPVDYAVVRKR